jgi:hypothetical protein
MLTTFSPMPATTIAEVIEQLNEIVKLAQQNSDRAGYFAALYKKVTVAVSDKINEKFFDDNIRMEKLDVVFANRYLDAYQQYKSGKPCSSSWQQAFDATHTWKPMVIDHLVAGMNAHIGLDLGIAAATIAPGNLVNGVQNDFNKINTVLNGLVDEVKTDLFAMWPLSKFISKLNASKLENAIAGFSMTIARDAAWQVALAYAPLNTDAAKESYITERDKNVAAFGKKLLHSGFFLTIVRTIFRLFEFGSIPKKIKRLNE